MKQIITRRLPKITAAPISLAAMLGDSLRLRKSMQTNMDGYPTGSHLIGRIMQRFKFSSKTELLESILSLRNLIRIAAEVLDRYISMPTAKYTLNRSELIPYIEMHAPMLGFTALSQADVEFIAALILDTESDYSSWMLQCASPETNFHVTINKLYSSCAADVPPAFGYDEEAKRFEVTSGQTIPIYDPEYDIITPLTNTARAQTIAGEINDEGSAIVAYGRLSNLYTTHQFAFMRIIDHVYSMFLDTEIWRNFVSVRLEVNAASNKERVKSLKLFASYLHSLLMYPHFFTLEAFKSTYGQLESFHIPFPPLAAHIIQKYEVSVTSKDALGAKQDIADIFVACNIVGDTLLDVPVFGMPLEFLDTFGLTKLINDSEIEAAKMSVPLSLSDISLLNDNKLNKLLSSQPINNFNMLGSIPRNLLIGSLVEMEINDAIMAITPGITRYYSETQMNDLKAANFKVRFGIAYPLAVSLDPSKCSTDDIRGGTLEYNPLLHRQSIALNIEYQRKQIYMIKKGSQFVKDYEPTNLIVNRDLMAKLSAHIGYDWKSLVPSQIGRGVLLRTRASIINEKETQRSLLESISGQSYEYIMKTINNPQAREIWATFISSFGLLYSFPSPEEVPIRNMGKKGETIANDAISAYLRPGYGMPYGTSYMGLATKQGLASATDFFQVDDEGLVFIRVLKKVPLPDDILSVTSEFYLNKSYYYYMSNGKTMDVNEFVLDSGLQNFALIPSMYEGYHPNILLDKLSAYINDTVFMNINYTFVPEIDTRCKQSFPIQTNKWVHDKLLSFLEFTTFGSYSELASSTSTLDADEKVTILNKMVTDMDTTTKAIIDSSPQKLANDSGVDEIKNMKVDLPKHELDENNNRKSATSLKKESKKPDSKDEDVKKKKHGEKDEKDDFDGALNG